MGHSEVDPAFKSAESAAELLGSRKHTGRGGIGGGCFPGRDLDPERSGCMRHCHVTVHGGRLLAFGQLKRVTLQQVAEEEEHLGLRQVVAQAHASTCATRIRWKSAENEITCLFFIRVNQVQV